MIMVDSDILIWILRGKNQFREKLLDLAETTDGMLFITPVQIAEIHAGLKKDEFERTEKLLDSLISIDVNRILGKLAGEFMKKYHKSHSLTLADAIIAAAAAENNLKMWTMNTKHYPMFRKHDFIT